MQMRSKRVEMERNGQLQELFGMYSWQDANYILYAELTAFYLAASCLLWRRFLATDKHYHKTPFS